MPGAKTCACCGKTFFAKNIRAEYCSDNCRQKAHYDKYYGTQAGPYHRTCVICGKEFTTTIHNKITCSDPCREENRRRVKRQRDADMRAHQAWRDPRPCRICGKLFTPVRPDNVVCRDPECRRLDNLNRQHDNKEAYYSRSNAKRREKRAAAAEKEKPLLAILKLGENVRADPKPKRSRRGPKPGTLGWCVREADKRGMSYGMFVAAMENGGIET